MEELEGKTKIIRPVGQKPQQTPQNGVSDRLSFPDTLVSAFEISTNASNYLYFNNDEINKSLAYYTKNGKNPMEFPGDIVRCWFSVAAAANAQISWTLAIAQEFWQFIKSSRVEISLDSVYKRKIQVEDFVVDVPQIITTATDTIMFAFPPRTNPKANIKLRLEKGTEITKIEHKFPEGASAYRPTAVLNGYLFKMHLDVLYYPSLQKSSKS